jgi:hypothetical protein
MRTNRKIWRCVEHIPGADVGLRQGVCHGRIPDDLVVTSGRATSQAISTMLDSMTSARAPTGVEPLSLLGDIQQLAGHCTTTITNGQPLRSPPVEYGQASCFAFRMLSVTASISLTTTVVHKRCRPLSSHSLDPRHEIVVGRTARIVCGPETRAPLSEEQTRVCGPTLPPVEHLRDSSSAASSLRRSEDHRVDFIKRSLDTLCPSLQCRRKAAPYHRLYISRSLAATNEVTGMVALVTPSNSQNRSPFTRFPR